jgi:hypothetical protein
MTPREQLADLLQRSRVEAGYGSQGALAKRLNVSRPVISKAVDGYWRRGVPAKLGLRAAAGGQGPALPAAGVLPVRRPAP